MDPKDASEIADAMTMLLSDSVAAERFSKKGRERAKIFSWSRTARETLAVYRKILATSGKTKVRSRGEVTHPIKGIDRHSHPVYLISGQSTHPHRMPTPP